MKLSQIILYDLKMCLLPLATLNRITRWRPIRRYTFYSSGYSFVHVGRQYHQEISVHDAPSRDAIYRPVKRMRKQEVCVINVRRDVNKAHLFVGKKSV
jgi:hypothetical protein